MKLSPQVPAGYEVDPTSIRNPAVLASLRVMIEHKAVHDKWLCPIVRFFLLGYLDNIPKRQASTLLEAGNIYQRIWHDYHRLMDTDPEEDLPLLARELAYHRIDKVKSDYYDSVETLGKGQKIANQVIIEELWPTTEREKKDLRDALVLLSNLYFGTKRE